MVSQLWALRQITHKINEVVYDGFGLDELERSYKSIKHPVFFPFSTHASVCILHTSYIIFVSEHQHTYVPHIMAHLELTHLRAWPWTIYIYIYILILAKLITYKHSMIQSKCYDSLLSEYFELILNFKLSSEHPRGKSPNHRRMRGYSDGNALVGYTI